MIGWRRGLSMLGIAATMLTVAAAHGATPHLVSLPAAIPADRVTELGGDLVELLSSRTGEPFALAVHDNTLTYLKDLAGGRFAVVFEGPHVLGALARRDLLAPVAEFNQGQSFVVVVPTAESGIYQLDDLAGKPLCAGEIPDLFALTLLDIVGNPSREPVIVPVAEPRNRVRRLLGGHCLAATLQTDRFLTLEQSDGADALRIIYKSRELPGFGVGVATDLPETTRRRIREVLLSANGRAATRALGAALSGGEAPLAESDANRYGAYAELMDTYFYD